MPDAPEQVKPYLDEIADRLWSNNAAVMVGAGFSQNAEPVGSTSESFPSWKTLGDIFYKKLHGKSPGEEARYLSLLKLAEQVQAAFGRPALDRLLLGAIPNLRYEPSRLHSDLLSLPWEDVFTTNYDTLLERACASVTLRHYDVVATTEDLLNANRPRIIKLHGSLPSPPFVITEEDYRRYPIDHAPFVNTVRQSLVENTLCLIGFSGDDPNFLQWIGWMRDQVGKEVAPKIYLVGVFEALSEADRKLLDGRGIVLVDLSGFDTDPGTALASFLEYLKRGRTRAMEWPMIPADAGPWAGDDNPEKYRNIVIQWRHQRRCYPGWVVMPEDRRRILWSDTQDWLSHLPQVPSTDRDRLETPLDLELAFELTWRLDRCLFPLTGELSTFLEEVALKYSDADLRMPDNTDWSKASVFEAVTNIRLWLLRHYREEGLDEKWGGVSKTIGHDFERLLPEHRARFRLEEALQALFRFDPAETKRLLVDWQSNDGLPFWEAKRAALMAELGEVAAAHSILEKSLSTIRKRQSLKPVAEDYTLVSQESVVMLLLWAVERGRVVKEPSTEDSNLLNELSERWNELARYKCDPRREIASFSARLGHPALGRKLESISHSFDLGMVSNTLHFGTDEEAVTAYGLLRMYEDIGMPYRIDHSTFVSEPVTATLPRVSPYSPHWALVNIVRLGDAKAADWLFTREYLAKLGRDEVDRYFDTYLAALDRAVAMIDDPDWSEAKTFESLAKTLPEVFSRLCYKCSPASRERLLAALGAIYGSKRKHVFAEVWRFARRLFDSMSVEERVRAVPPLIDFPVPEFSSDMERREYVNPLLLVNLPEAVREEALEVPTDRIDQLLERLADGSQDRDWTATMLVWLNDRGKLNGRQSERLGRLLWEGIETPSLPEIWGLASFACIGLPHPEEVDLQARAKKHLLSMIGERMGDSRFDDVLEELRNSAGKVEWSKAEAFDLVAKLSEWWDKNKYHLHLKVPTPFGLLSDQTKRKTSTIVNALSAVFSQFPANADGNADTVALRAFISDLAAHGTPTTRLEVATLSMVAESRERLLGRVASAMLDSERDHVGDALAAARTLANALDEQVRQFEFAEVGTMLAAGVQWRHRPALAGRLRIAAELVDSQPWFLSSDTETSLLSGLRQIEDETSSCIKGNDEDGVISIRASAASLAFALFEHYEQSGSDVPQEIQRWRELCSDPNEFSEVHNAWMDAST